VKPLREYLKWVVPPLVVMLYRRLRGPIDAVEEELERLVQLPRCEPTTTSLVGRPLRLVDGPSAVSAYKAIFRDEIYRFKTDRADPFIIDCGANVGLSVAYFKRVYPSARVLAFEPDPNIFQCLKDNCAAYTNVELRNEAVSAQRGSLSFVAQGADGGHLTEEGTCADGRMITVAAARLWDYLTAPVDMLKMDIEGAEVEVLVDCADRLPCVKNLFVEYHSFLHQEQRLDELLHTLRVAGFRVHIQPELVSARPFLSRQVSNGKDMRLNIFCLRSTDAAVHHALH
jgi:FkbM family methyltransferase